MDDATTAPTRATHWWWEEPILQALTLTGSKRRACEIVGVPRSTFQKELARSALLRERVRNALLRRDEERARRGRRAVSVAAAAAASW